LSLFSEINTCVTVCGSLQKSPMNFISCFQLMGPFGLDDFSAYDK